MRKVIKMWNAGYVSELDYTYGYYSEFNPTTLQFALTYNSFEPPEIRHACELGFGQGLTLAFNANTTAITWYGTDFNPSQANFVKKIIEADVTDKHITDEDFAAFCSRTDLPKFDFIALHGVWSWISDENRKLIMKFIHEKLNVGGVVYVSYNTEAGWTSMLPMRKLMLHYIDRNLPPHTPLPEKINAAINFMEQLLETNPKFFVANPNAAERIKLMKNQPIKYIAHEFFNKDWEPTNFPEMQNEMTTAKMTFATSANLLDTVETINVTEQQRKILHSVSDVTLKEQCKDMMLNQTFRKEYWVKGARRLTKLERDQRLLDMKIVCLQQHEFVKLTAKGNLGEAKLDSNIYEPILSAISVGESKKLRSIFSDVTPSISIDQFLEAIMFLLSNGSIAVATSSEITKFIISKANKMNRKIIEKSRYSDEIQYLASPVLSGGAYVSRFEQLFLLAMGEGKKNPLELAKFVWNIIKEQGQFLIKDGETLKSDEDNVEQLTKIAEKFLANRIEIFSALKINF